MKGDLIYDQNNVKVYEGSLTQEQLADAVRRFIINVERERYEKEFIRNQQKKMVTNN